MCLKKLFTAFLCFNALNAFLCSGKSAEEWKTRVIYQILTDRFAQTGSMPTTKCTDMRGWCGGTFKGIENNLDYITSLGFNAIWISPVVLNTERGFHGYWAKDLYQIEPHFGTKSELQSLVKACHQRDVWVMVDVVANHMGYPPSTNWTTPSDSPLLDDFSGFHPFNKSEYFHPKHAYIRWPEECHDVKKIQKYWLANLPDLNQSHPFVGQELLNWVKYLIQEYDFDGCRVDTVIQVPKPFWSKFQKAGNVFMLGEANNGPPPCGSLNFTAGFQGPLDAVLNFPLYWTLRYIFQEKKQTFRALSVLLDQSADAFRDSSIIGGFIDNHDHARFLSLNPSFVALRNNLVYVFMSQCIPILYYGTEQGFNGEGDPNNRESLWPYMDTTHVLYRFVKQLLQIRGNQSRSWLESSQIERHVGDNVYAFSRKGMLVVITTEMRNITATVKSHPFKAGQRVHNLLNKKEIFQVSSTGEIKTVLTGGEPLILTTLGTNQNCANKFSLSRGFSILIAFLSVISGF